MNEILFSDGFQDLFELNTNIFDTNLINLSIVLFVVIRFLGEFLSNTLETRRKLIIDNLQNSNKKILLVKDELNKLHWSEERYEPKWTDMKNMDNCKVAGKFLIVNSIFKESVDSAKWWHSPVLPGEKCEMGKLKRGTQKLNLMSSGWKSFISIQHQAYK